MSPPPLARIMLRSSSFSRPRDNLVRKFPDSSHTNPRAGFGPGIPGLQLGFGLGVGCGIGIGFGYGVGRGVAYVENRKYSNVGKLFHGPGNFPTHDGIGTLVDDIIINTKKLIEATSREVDKWRR